MADEPAEPPAQHDDFASAAIRSLTNDPEKPAPAPVVTKTEEPKRTVPEELFKSKEPEKKEPAKSEDIEEPEFKNPKSKEGWTRLKAAKSEVESKLQAAEAKLAEAEAKGKDTTALEQKLAALEAQHATALAKAKEYQELVQKVNVELDPEFRKTFVEGRRAVMDRAKKIIEDSGGDPAAIENALNLRGKERVSAMREVATDLSNFEASRLGRAIDELDALDDQAAAKRGNPDEYLKQRQEQETTRQRQESDQFQKDMAQAHRDAVRVASEKFILAKKLDGPEFKTWNDGIDGAVNEAEKFWSTNTDPRAAAERNVKASLYDIAERGFMEMRTERDTWKEKAEKHEKELAKLYGKGPRIGGGDTGAKGVKGGGDFASVAIEHAGYKP